MTELFGNLDQVFAYLSAAPLWWGLLLLGASAMFEYVFPPFPGDTVVLVGAVLIPRAGWPFWAVFAAVMVGTSLGATIDWAVGLWLADNREGSTWLHSLIARESVSNRIDAVQEQFKKYGPIYLAANRFVPAFRAVFFVAAGLAEIRLWKVLVYGSISAGLWNAALLGAGWAVGYKLEALADLVATYSRWFALAAGVLVAGWLAKKAWDWHRAS